MDTEKSTITLLELIRKVKDIQRSVNEIKDQIRQLKLPNRSAPQIKKITNVVEVHYNLIDGIIYTRSRKREIVEARQVSMLIASYTTGFSYAGIGMQFNRDHASVSHAKKVLRNLFEFDVDICNRFIKICNELEISNEVINEMITND